jgi:hypothetical protein
MVQVAVEEASSQCSPNAFQFYLTALESAATFSPRHLTDKKAEALAKAILNHLAALGVQANHD